jgi:hypothetical protein
VGEGKAGIVGAALQIVRAVVSVSFLALGVFTVVDWPRRHIVGAEADADSESRLA